MFGIGRDSTGFTLVELLVVAVLLAIFAAVIVVRLQDTPQDSRVAAAEVSVRAMQGAVDRYHAQHGHFPPRIDKNWFRGYQMPQSPYLPLPEDGEAANVNTEEGKVHPTYKTEVGGPDNPYWYNPSNGTVRIRVPQQATNAQTLDLYNRANGTSARSLNQETY